MAHATSLACSNSSDGLRLLCAVQHASAHFVAAIFRYYILIYRLV